MDESFDATLSKARKRVTDEWAARMNEARVQTAIKVVALLNPHEAEAQKEMELVRSLLGWRSSRLSEAEVQSEAS